MAKYRPYGSKKAKGSDSKRGLIPCVILLLAGFAFMALLLYGLLTSSGK